MHREPDQEQQQQQQPDELAVYEAVLFRDNEEDLPEDAGVVDGTNNNVVETSSTSTISNRTRDDKDTVFLVKIFCLIVFVYALIVLYLAGNVEDIILGNTSSFRSAEADRVVSLTAISTETIHHETKIGHSDRYQPPSVRMEGTAVDLTEANFDHFLEQHEMAFVNFCAPGATFCESLAPIWEEVAQEVNKENIPIGIGKIDCMAEVQLCRKHYVIAFPTMRLFNNGTKVEFLPDYTSTNTVDNLMMYLKSRVEKYELGKD